MYCHIRDLPSTVSSEVRQAMLSLSSSEPHPDLEGAFATIQAGGAKAKGTDFTSSSLN